MIRLRRALICLLLVGCAPSLPRKFEQARAAAERAYAAGRYDEAAEEWRRAGEAAERPRDKNEASYRAAASLRRAGRRDEARALLAALVAEHPKSARAVRAEFDLADMEIEGGNREHGYSLLERAVRSHPSSGIAPAALAKLARHAEDQNGPDGAVAYLDRMRQDLGKTELGERAQFTYARRLDGLGRDEEALAAYLDSAKRFPYPNGALWDDALWYASLLEEKLGRPERAVAHLERMLAEREPSSLQGSYERPRYASARFRIAELYRDRLADDSRARREFHRVFTDHPTSPLRDDALWNEARLARKAGDRALTCSLTRRLVEDSPDSRFAPCVRALCPDNEPAKGECHAYILRALDGGGESNE